MADPIPGNQNPHDQEPTPPQENFKDVADSIKERAHDFYTEVSVSFPRHTNIEGLVSDWRAGKVVGDYLKNNDLIAEVLTDFSRYSEIKRQQPDVLADLKSRLQKLEELPDDQKKLISDEIVAAHHKLDQLEEILRLLEEVVQTRDAVLGNDFQSFKKALEQKNVNAAEELEKWLADFDYDVVNAYPDPADISHVVEDWRKNKLPDKESAEAILADFDLYKEVKVLEVEFTLNKGFQLTQLEDLPDDQKAPIQDKVTKARGWIDRINKSLPVLEDETRKKNAAFTDTGEMQRFIDGLTQFVNHAPASPDTGKDAKKNKKEKKEKAQEKFTNLNEFLDKKVNQRELNPFQKLANGFRNSQEAKILASLTVSAAAGMGAASLEKTTTNIVPLVLRTGLAGYGGYIRAENHWLRNWENSIVEKLGSAMDDEAALAAKIRELVKNEPDEMARWFALLTLSASKQGLKIDAYLESQRRDALKQEAKKKPASNTPKKFDKLKNFFVNDKTKVGGRIALTMGAPFLAGIAATEHGSNAYGMVGPMVGALIGLSQLAYSRMGPGTPKGEYTNVYRYSEIVQLIADFVDTNGLLGEQEKEGFRDRVTLMHDLMRKRAAKEGRWGILKGVGIAVVAAAAFEGLVQSIHHFHHSQPEKSNQGEEVQPKPRPEPAVDHPAAPAAAGSGEVPQTPDVSVVHGPATSTPEASSPHVAATSHPTESVHHSPHTSSTTHQDIHVSDKTLDNATLHLFGDDVDSKTIDNYFNDHSNAHGAFGHAGGSAIHRIEQHQVDAYVNRGHNLSHEDEKALLYELDKELRHSKSYHTYADSHGNVISDKILTEVDGVRSVEKAADHLFHGHHDSTSHAHAVHTSHTSNVGRVNIAEHATSHVHATELPHPTSPSSHESYSSGVGTVSWSGNDYYHASNGIGEVPVDTHAPLGHGGVQVAHPVETSTPEDLHQNDTDFGQERVGTVTWGSGEAPAPTTTENAAHIGTVEWSSADTYANPTGSSHLPGDVSPAPTETPLVIPHTIDLQELPKIKLEVLQDLSSITQSTLRNVDSAHPEYVHFAPVFATKVADLLDTNTSIDAFHHLRDGVAAARGGITYQDPPPEFLEFKEQLKNDSGIRDLLLKYIDKAIDDLSKHVKN